MKPDAPVDPRSPLILGFFIVWGAVGVTSHLYFNRPGDVALKRKWFPRVAVLSGILFVAFVSAGLASGAVPGAAVQLLLIVPATALICWLNIRMTTFCGSCESMIYSSTWWTTLNFCPKCGADLRPKPDDEYDFLE